MIAIIFAGLAGTRRATAATSAPEAVPAGPRLQFASTVLDFGKAAAGQVIEHDFVFTNTGDRVLEIKDVRPTCGCTIAGAWDRHVEPGRSGRIPIRFTPEYHDAEISKTVIVDDNDPAQTNVILRLIGRIWEPIEVTPAFVMFGASTDTPTNQAQSVRIVNRMDEPLVLSEPATGDRAFRATVKTVRPGREFEVQIAMTPPLRPGDLTVPITVKTSSTNLPVIHLTAFSKVLLPVTATPAHFELAPGPLAAGAQPEVIIENHGARALTLSDPTMNVPGGEVRLKELQAGRRFRLTAEFPAGFQAPHGQSVEVRVQTDDPAFPVVTVPVVQNERLAALLNEP